MTDPAGHVEAIAEVLLSELENNGLDDMGFDVDQAAAAILAALTGGAAVSRYNEEPQ